MSTRRPAAFRRLRQCGKPEHVSPYVLGLGFTPITGSDQTATRRLQGDVAQDCLYDGLRAAYRTGRLYCLVNLGDSRSAASVEASIADLPSATTLRDTAISHVFEHVRTVLQQGELNPDTCAEEVRLLVQDFAPSRGMSFPACTLMDIFNDWKQNTATVGTWLLHMDRCYDLL